MVMIAQAENEIIKPARQLAADLARLNLLLKLDMPATDNSFCYTLFATQTNQTHTPA